MTLRSIVSSIIVGMLSLVTLPTAMADLKEIKKAGVIRHLGIPYANFVTGHGDGLDVEIIRLYAQELGVAYEYAQSSWETVISDLSGKRAIPKGEDVEIIGESEVRGDIIGNGLTVLPWREKLISFSSPYFPTAIWVVARVDSELRPIIPTGDLKKDLAATRLLLKGRRMLGIPNTCLDPVLYDLEGVEPIYKEGVSLNDVAPALIARESEVSILDVPDSLVALAKYPDKIKVLGVITERQSMAFGIAKDSPQLLASFNAFLEKLEKNGILKKLIFRYYPGIEYYFPEMAND